MVYLTLFYVQWHECVRSSWNWIYSHLCAAAMWVLGMELTSSGRATKLFNGVLQIENKKTRQKQTDSLIFKSEFQDSQDYYIKLPEFKSAISQFQQECLQRSQEKKKTNKSGWMKCQSQRPAPLPANPGCILNLIFGFFLHVHWV